MSQNMQSKIDSFGIMQSEWMRRQVEGHLLIGSVYKYVPFFLVGSILFIILLVDGFWEDKPSAVKIADMVEFGLMAVAFVFCSFYFSRYHQAVIGWFAVKIGMGTAAFIMMTVGTCVSLSRHQSDAVVNFLIGMMWLPSLEFIPAVSPHQRKVTIGRFILTIPLVYFGIKSGHWS